ncbi:hypothetical protein ACFZDJ_06200 [Streptomyces sp. NPDC007896]|uniref:hypothetical protein n=1 Tax=Streptomyces sp. NPDC007896 TaxID=3364784 RepID=UPI0036E9B416
MDSARTYVDAVNAPWPYVDAVHGKPKGSAPDALLFAVLALFVREEVGADQGGVFAAEDGGVRERSYVDRRHPCQPMTARGREEPPQQRLHETGDMVQHVFNSSAVEGHAPGPSQAVAGVLLSAEIARRMCKR